MEYIIVFIVVILAAIVIKNGMDVKLKDIKIIKEIGYDKELNNITNQFPENKKVCKDILKQLNNEDVIIEENNEKNAKASFYMVMTNHIIIANIKDTFTRIQTIAHECAHSVQNRKTLMFNFIFSNVYLLYFLTASILTICKVIENPMAQIAILAVMGLIQYMVRSYLETEAMTKAPYIAKEYMENKKVIQIEKIKEVMDAYHQINRIGIPLVNYKLILSVLIKIAVYCIIAIVMV